MTKTIVLVPDMITISITPLEFKNFKALANMIDLKFDFYVKRGIVFIESLNVKLKDLGY